MKVFIQTFLLSSVLGVVALSLALNFPQVFAAVMTSSNYSIQSDSVNFGGGSVQSASYAGENTFGEVATGDSSSASYNLKAGYQQMVLSSISMSAAAGVTMSPSLGGITGGTSNGSTVTTVTTDNAAGYEVYFKASSSPAMVGNAHGDSIANYVTGGSDPDFTFSVPATAARFGFSPEGTDIASKYKDNGSVCNIGSTDTANACWNAVSTTNDTIVHRASANTPTGTATTIKFRLTIGSSAFKLQDVYTATTTLTAVVL